MQPLHRRAARALFAALLAAPASAQIEAYDVWGAQGSVYGSPLVVVGDVDLDGFADWATADRLYDAAGALDAGRVWIHSGVDGALLSRVTGNSPGQQLGHELAGLGDVDGDGRADFAAMAYSSGAHVEVRAGHDGGLIHAIVAPPGSNDWAQSLWRLDDLSGDGIAELAIGDRGEAPSTADRLWIHSGADGSVVRVLQVPDGQFDTHFGIAAASVGDLDGDLVPEVIVGAPYFCIGCLHVFAGGAFVFRGSDGTLLRSHHAGEGTVEELGVRVVGVGDADGDGTPDYAAQAQYPSRFVRLYSGASGALLHQYEFGSDEFIGWGVHAMDDLDGDGAPELVVVPETGGEDAHALVASCAPPYGEVERIPGRFTTSYDAWIIASPGDLTGDGTPDLLVGEPAFLDHAPPWPDALHTGRVALVALDERSVDAARECPPTGNSTGLQARIWYRGSLRASAGTLEMLAWNLPSNQFGIVYHGPNAIELPFGNGIRCVGGALTRFAPVNAGSDGIVQVPVPASLMPPPAVTARFQFWYRDPAAGGAGFDFSDVVALTLAP